MASFYFDGPSTVLTDLYKLGEEEYITSILIGQPYYINCSNNAGTSMTCYLYADNVSEIEVGSINTIGYIQTGEYHYWYDDHGELTKFSTYSFSETDGKKFKGKNLCLRISVPEGLYSGRITVTFSTTFVKYSITVVQTSGGTITATPTSAAKDATVSLSVSADAGYRFVSWTKTPSTISIASNNTFKMPGENVSISATFERIHTLSWENPNLLVVSQNEYTLTAKLTGHATDTWSHTITYKLYGYNGAGQTIFNETFGAASNDIRTVQLSITDANIGVQYTFKAYAVCSANNAEGPSFTITPANVHKTVQYRVNGQWVECIPYYRINDRWQEVEPYYRNEGIWIPCSKT